MKKSKRLRLKDVPKWANSILVHSNGIDGCPPSTGVSYTVADYLELQDNLMRRQGGGEWDIIVYATSMTVNDWQNGVWPEEVYPYDNSYSVLRSTPKIKVKHLTQWSYMDV